MESEPSAPLSQPDRPQIGVIDVDPDALAANGEDLRELAVRLGADVTELPATAEDGWRVLAREHGSVMLGAPMDERRVLWRLAMTSERGGGPVRIHPDLQSLRRSRAERRRGLALRWPDSMRTRPDPARLAVDIVNTGDEVWRPDGDSFHVIGGIVRESGDTASGSFAFMGGQDPAMELGPGEYARVPVHIDSAQWKNVEPGVHHVQAILVNLGLRSQETLRIKLSGADLERLRPRAPRGRGIDAMHDPRSHLTERLEMLRTLIAARAKLDELVEVIVSARDDADANVRVQELLGCSPIAAELVASTQLRRFSTERVRLLQLEERDILQALDRLDQNH